MSGIIIKTNNDVFNLKPINVDYLFLLMSEFLRCKGFTKFCNTVNHKKNLTANVHRGPI